jgi:hypothetical protein
VLVLAQHTPTQHYKWAAQKIQLLPQQQQQPMQQTMPQMLLQQPPLPFLQQPMPHQVSNNKKSKKILYKA